MSSAEPFDANNSNAERPLDRGNAGGASVDRSVPEPKPWPSVWPYARRAAFFGLGFLALALAFVPADWPARSMLFLIPTVAMMGGGLSWMGRVRREAPANLRLDRYLRGWTGICLFTALLAAIWIIVWHVRFRPEMLQAWLANVEEGLEAQGYSPGDADEALHRIRVTLTGPLGVFIGTVLWTVTGLIPGLVFSVLQLRELTAQNR